MSFQAMTWAIEQAPADAESKLLLLLLANYAGHDNSCWPSVSTLSKQSVLCETTVRDRLRLLVEAGLITITPRRTEKGDATSNLYTLTVGTGGRPTRPPPTSPDEAPPSRRDPPLPRAARSNQSVEPVIDPKREEAAPPMKEDLRSKIEAMHREFCTQTFTQPNLMAYDRYWFELARNNYSAQDVEIFCLWVKHENLSREPQYQRKFHIPRMFGDLAEFDADLCVARAWYRNLRPEPTMKEAALQQLRPTVDPELAKARLNPARSAGEALGRILKGQPNQ